MAVKCTNVTLSTYGQSLYATWKLSSGYFANLQDFEVKKYHRPYNGKEVYDGNAFLDIWSHYDEHNQTFYYYFDQPDSANAKDVWFEVQPRAIGYGENAKFVGEWVKSAAVVLDAWTAAKNSYDTAVKKGDALKKTADSNKTAAQDYAAQARSATAAGDHAKARELWGKCEKAWTACETNADDASEWYSQGADYADAAGIGAAEVARLEGLASTYATMADTAGANADDAAALVSSEETLRLKSVRYSAAVTIQDKAKTAHANAVEAAGNGSYAKAVSYEQDAAAKWKLAASKWNLLASMYEEGSSTREQFEGYATRDEGYAETHKGHADSYQATVNTQNAIQAAKLAVPDTPEASVEVPVSTSYFVRIVADCEAEWANEIRVYRSEDGGSYSLVKTFSRSVPASGGAWAQQIWNDDTLKRGHVYRYYLVSRTEAGRVSPRTEIYGLNNPFMPPPARPTELTAKLVGTNNVRLEWVRNGQPVTVSGYVVEYSSWYEDGQNAWQAGNTGQIDSEEIESASATTHTMTFGDDQLGKRWYFRLKAQNDTGDSYYATAPNTTSTFTVSVMVPAAPKDVVTAPTNLKCSEIATGTVKVTWDDAKVGTSGNVSLRDGEKYVIQHTSNQLAFTNNIAADIDSVDYVPISRSYLYYSFTDLELGVKHFFRLQKVGADGTIAWAKTPEGDASRWNANRCYAALAAASASISAPTNLTATALPDGSIKLAWSDSQLPDETYDIWSTDNARAFDNNAMGDIEQTTFAEYTNKTAHSFTLTDLEPGTTIYAKVRKRNSEGAGAFSGTANATTPSDATNNAKPTGMTATVTQSGGVTIEWTDKVQDGATYVIRRATRLAAFAENADDIVETDFTPEQVSGKPAQFLKTFTGLEKGARHFFQVKKTLGTSSKLASAAKGSTSRADAEVVAAYLDADALSTPLQAPTDLTAEVSSTVSTNIVLTWGGTQSSGQSYEIQHTTNPAAFAESAIGDISSDTFEDETSAGPHVFTITGLDAGSDVYIRVRKVSSDNRSNWTVLDGYVSVPPDQETMEELYAPLCAQLAASYSVGDDVILSWLHQSSDGSAQSGFQLAYTVNGADGVQVVGTTDSAYVLDTSSLDDGDVVRWSVRTAGVYEGLWSPWSAVQQFNVYEKPSAGLALTDGSGASVTPLSPLTRLPLNAAVTGSTTGENGPMEYRVEIVANDAHESTNPDGTARLVSAGETVWSASIQRGDDGFSESGWTAVMSATDAVLDDGQSYTARAFVTTRKGLRSEPQETAFSVDWADIDIEPLAAVVFDADSLTCEIAPACPRYAESAEAEEAEEEDDETPEGSATDEDVLAAKSYNMLPDEPADGTPTGYGQEDDDEVAWSAELRENTVLAVYRINKDGTTTLIGDNLANDGLTRCTDPHPTFGRSTYRVVATDTETGIQGYADFYAETPCGDAVIQWNETAGADGYTLRLPYNVAEDEGYQPDVALRSYVGRFDRVAYYGTHLDESLTIGAALLYTDSERMELARRLGAHRGSCYVRTPSGLGFAASVSVSMSQRYGSGAVSVTVSCEKVAE